jgi:hypothetical protein
LLIYTGAKMDISGVPEIVIYIGACTGAVVAIVGAFRRWFIEPAARKFTEAVKEQMEPIEAKLDLIQHEVEINSGKSLKDVVIKGFNNNDTRMSRLEGELTVVKDILSSHIASNID